MLVLTSDGLSHGLIPMPLLYPGNEPVLILHHVSDDISLTIDSLAFEHIMELIKGSCISE